MVYEVKVEHVEPQPTAIVRRRARPEELATVVPQGCGEVWEFVRKVGNLGPGRNIALYLDSEINLEVGVEVAGSFVGDGEIVPSHIPAGTVVTTTHLGPYNQLGAANEAIHGFCQVRGLKLAGPSWEVYGHMIDDLTPPRTDVFYLLSD